MHKLLITITLLTLSQMSYSTPMFSQCSDLTSNKKKYITCLDEQLKRDYRVRKTWIQKISDKLELKQNNSGNTALMVMFKRSIDTFNLYLEDNCRFRFLEKMPNSHSAIVEYKHCEALLIKQHTESLRKYSGK